MRVEYHTGISIGVAGALFALSRSWELALASIIGGVLIDVDHLGDYLSENWRRPGLRDFFHACYNGRLRCAYLLLHSWEVLLLVIAAAVATGWEPWLTGLAIGWMHHMAADQVANEVTPLGFSLLWRATHGFTAVSTFRR